MSLAMINVEDIINSYRNISFTPEKRGRDDYEYYTALLEEDLQNLGPRYDKEIYARRFARYVGAIVNARAKCASSMITGPANFPAFKNNLAWENYFKKVEAFDRFREKAEIKSNAARTKSPEEEIDAAIAEIDKLEFIRERAKEFNKIKENADRIMFLETFFPHLDQWDKDYVLKTGKMGTGADKIRRLRKKIEIMRTRIKNRCWRREFNGGEIYIENNRVVIRHDNRPDKDVITAIKRHGFKWSPKYRVWVRKHTGNAIWDAERLLEVFNGKNK